MSAQNITREELNRQFDIKPEYFNYTPFYVVISICTILAAVLLLVNWICCCCHEHQKYWSDPDTGNRFAAFIFVRKPKQRPLDVLF
ncbi:wurmchen 1 transmembrane protein isoform X2 [Oratosquilla oratoria]|uniref:wurmchen 1 transmembrane protein isoform X2 n=1 Tax=Oratosquilla oratoria TaxID=337810 RepID=UPI003F764539